MQISAFAYSPVGMSGVKSISHELHEQAASIDRQAWDHVFCMAGGGGLTLAADDSGAAKTLSTEVDKLQKSAVEALAYTEYVSYYQWLALAALLLLALEQLLRWQKNAKP